MNAPPLTDYGIFQDLSDIHAHVGILARKVYVFPTQEGVLRAASGIYRPVYSRQPGYSTPTSKGYKIPITDFHDLRIVDLNTVNWFIPPSEQSSTSSKGRFAQKIVLRLLSEGRFPMWIDGMTESRPEPQIEGADIIVSANLRIQVKCDYRAGSGHPQCTGNLYIEVAECNPTHAF